MNEFIKNNKANKEQLASARNGPVIIVIGKSKKRYFKEFSKEKSFINKLLKKKFHISLFKQIIDIIYFLS